ncbi:hypothetical protein ACRYCC_10685 [Actinomadura scrupuli]|uniref:hypothetical protein n=1 Tax=Actinomadura scrupuli TaxID=559629 RepID=UPI003D95E7A8
MAFRIPRPRAEALPQGLEELFRLAGADWTRERRTKADKPNICPTDAQRRAYAANVASRGGRRRPVPAVETWDRWLAQEFPAMVLALADRLEASPEDRLRLRQALARADLKHAAAVTSRLVTLSPLVRKGENAPDPAIDTQGSLSRSKACEYVSGSLDPLLTAADYRSWLDRLLDVRPFVPGARPGSPRVPPEAARLEALRDDDLARTWLDPPQPPANQNPAQRRAYERELQKYLRRRATVQAFVQSEPAAPGLRVQGPLTAGEAARLDRVRGQAAASPGAAVVFPRGQVKSANLFIGEIADTAGGYLAVLEAALPGGPLSQALLGAAYGMLALALVPINCLYDRFHGTCAVESLLPRLTASAAELKRYPAERLWEALGPLADPKNPADARLVAAFSELAVRLADRTQQAHFRLAELAADQGGGRVRIPQSFSPGGSWRFPVTTDDGDVEFVVPEIFECDLPREPNREIFWILPSVWPPLATAVALVNQAGMRFWINASNNRWGGAHPPHSAHRQGTSVDADVGLGWVPNGKVPNIKARDERNFPLSDREVPGNSKRPECLTGIDRLAGWILVQALTLTGITQYLYGDRGLVAEATAHLAAQLTVDRPAALGGTLEMKVHADHWHFEVLSGGRPAGKGDYVWQVDDENLLDRLYELAVARDEDDTFWAKMAGLREAPRAAEDFNGIKDGEHWRTWWQRGRNGPTGVSLLPVWTRQLATDTLGPRNCMDPRDMPVPATDEGEAAG